MATSSQTGIISCVLSDVTSNSFLPSWVFVLGMAYPSTETPFPLNQNPA